MASTKIEELAPHRSLASWPKVAGLTAREMRESALMPPATLTRALREMPDLLRLGAGPRMQYALRDREAKAPHRGANLQGQSRGVLPSWGSWCPCGPMVLF